MRRATRKRNKIKVILLIFILIACFSWYYINEIRPLVIEYVLADVRNQMNLMVNELVFKEISDNTVTYNTLVHIEKGTDGQITSISSDISNMNKLKMTIEDKILNKILKIGKINVEVPIGSFFGNELLLGRGPEINISAVPVAEVYAKFENQFNSAGVNQTQHRIMLNYDLKLKLMLPGKREETVVSSSVCVAETVVVGLVPRLFSGSQN